MNLSRNLSAVLIGFLVIVPAHAADSTALPEPSSLVLFGIGAAGVMIGRKLSMKRPKD